MLEPWIIEQIRRREEEERRRDQRPQLEVPVPDIWPTRKEPDAHDEAGEDEKPKRGVAIIGM